MKKIRVIGQAVLLLFSIAYWNTMALAQGGDQILDGIGETGLIARYLFNGDTRDWSRNNLHAKVEGNELKFDRDDRFGNVLSLGNDAGGYVSIPSQVLNDVESFGLSTWVFLRTAAKDQQVLELQVEDQPILELSTSEESDYQGFQLGFRTSFAEDMKTFKGQALKPNTWVFLTLVIDFPSKSLRVYGNSQPLGDPVLLGNEFLDGFSSWNSEELKVYFGGSPDSPMATLDGLVHDLRLYRIPLNERQIAGIYSNAGATNQANAQPTKKVEDELPQFDPNQPQLYNAFLVSVSDVEVETELGELPRLPTHVDGVYRDQVSGPKVRVIWPAPSDNSAVLKTGNYTVIGRVPGTDFQPKVEVTVVSKRKESTPSLKLATFGLDQVSLDPGLNQTQTKFIENRDKFIHTLADTDPDSFLYMFRHAFGQTQPEGAEPLGVWDSQETKLRGHATGHYLTAIAQAYAGTAYDQELQSNFAMKMEYLVNALYDLSQLSGNPAEGMVEAVSDPNLVPKGPGKSSYDSDLSDEGIRQDYWNWGRGFISAYPPDQFIMLEQGAKYGGQKNQIWAPYYTLHKILAGLIDVYKVSGNEKALAVAVGMGDWVYQRLSAVPQDTLISMWNTYIAGEFGGMNETMATLYDITGDPKFLKTAQLFDNIKVFFGDAEHSHGLAKNVDTFRGLHANQHIPQIVGSLEMYRVSQESDYFKVADNYWFRAVNDYSYSIGGVAGARNPTNAECFIAQPASLYENGFASGGQNETCATYNMLKLTGNLFLFEQKAEYMDYYERSLYNHILASVAKDSPANTYHVPLRPGSIKRFGNPEMTGFTCCNGTAIESSTKLQNSIYFRSKEHDAIYVNLFIPSTLNWHEKGITIKQSTSFPKEDQTRLMVSGNGEFDLHIRIPSWATKGFYVKINGEDFEHDFEAGSYLKLSRNWKKGDLIELEMPFQFHLSPVMDQPNISSLFYGPVLLAAQETEAMTTWRKINLDANDLGKTIQGNPEELAFTIDGIEFKPFYETYGRHSVYLDVSLK